MEKIWWVERIWWRARVEWPAKSEEILWRHLPQAPLFLILVWQLRVLQKIKETQVKNLSFRNKKTKVKFAGKPTLCR
jgi:hypothetical protein